MTIKHDTSRSFLTPSYHEAPATQSAPTSSKFIQRVAKGFRRAVKQLFNASSQERPRAHVEQPTPLSRQAISATALLSLPTSSPSASDLLGRVSEELPDEDSFSDDWNDYFQDNPVITLRRSDERQRDLEDSENGYTLLMDHSESSAQNWPSHYESSLSEHSWPSFYDTLSQESSPWASYYESTLEMSYEAKLTAAKRIFSEKASNYETGDITTAISALKLDLNALSLDEIVQSIDHFFNSRNIS